MGCRIHIHTKHEIEYGNGLFNWQEENLKHLICDGGCNVYELINSEDLCGGIDWEINIEEFKHAIKKIEKMSADDIAKYFDDDYVGEDKDKFKESVLSGLKYCQEHGDSRDGYLHFSWY